jgi:hypothetical protein
MIREVYKKYSYGEDQSGHLSFEELMEAVTAGKLVLRSWVWSDPICYGLKPFCVQEFFRGQSWNYIKNKREFGPVSTQELENLYRMRVISTETPVKMCDQMYWHRYELVSRRHLIVFLWRFLLWLTVKSRKMFRGKRGIGLTIRI